MNRIRCATWRAIAIAAAAASASLVVGTTSSVGAATLVVDDNGDSIADDGVTTLREAVRDAGPGDTIVFDSALIGDTITLSSAIVITDDLVITGLGVSALTVESLVGPTLAIGSGAALTITDLRVGGASTGIQAKNSGDVQIDRLVVSGAVTGIEFDSPGADLRLSGTFVDSNSGPGIVVDHSDHVALTNATARDNGSGGLQATDPTGAIGSLRLENSDLSRNGASGVHAHSVTGDVVVVDSFLEDNAGRGLNVDQVGGVASMSRTSALRNAGEGIRLGPVTGDVVVDELDVSDNAGTAGLEIDASESDSVSVTASTVSRNASFGLIVKAVSGRLVVEDTEFDENTSAGLNFDGGQQSAVIEVTNSSLRGNGGSGISLEAVEGLVSISDVVSADNVDGVVVFGGGSGGVDIERVTVDGNETGLSVSGSSGPVSVSNSTISNSIGLGILVDLSTGSVTVTDSTISDSTEFGIVVEDSSGPVAVERLTFTGNATAVAGLGSASSVRVVNSTFTGNATAATEATVRSVGAELEVVHSTLTGNAATSGAPLLRATNGGSVVLDHSIATGNGSGSLSSVDPGSTVSATHSLLPSGSSLGATNIEASDPKLGPLADNGGETATMLPDSDSPAVDAGDPLIGSFPGTDQRGAARILGPAIDIGAVETAAVTADAITSLPPARYVDTRTVGDTFDDRFQAEGRRAADSEYRVTIAGRGGVPADARAVVINVTAVAATLNGFVTVHPCVSPRPLASSLNYTAGVNLPNEIVAPLTATGELCLYTNRAIDMLVDVVGYVDVNSPLEPLTPARYLDTRPGGDTFDDLNQRGGIPGAGSTTTLPVAGRGGIPANAAAVIVNVTAVGATQRGFVTVHPCLATPPLASSLNHVAGVNRANELIASVDASGNICLFTSRAIHLVVDVVGYLPAGSTYTAISPARFLDTRASGETIDDVSQREGLVGAGEQYELQVAGRPGVPAAATAAVVNVTAAGPVSRGFVTVHPCVSPRPNASSLNYVAGVNGANELITQLDADGKICLYTNRPVNLIVDVVGWLG